MLKLALLLFLAAPLAAQMTGVMRAEVDLATLGQLEATLNPHQPSLLVLEGPEGAWDPAFRLLFRREPLAERFPWVGYVHLDSGLGAARELVAREGWDATPRWILMNAKGEILRHGTERPSAEALAQALAGAGWTSPLDDTTRALGERPELVPLKLRRLELLRDLAEVRMREKLGLPEASRTAETTVRVGRTLDGYVFTSASEASPADLDPIAAAMTEGEDERIWGDYARALGGLVEDPAWADGTGGVGLRLVMPLPTSPAWLRASPRCRDAAAKVLDAVEALLHRLPTSQSLWGVWIPLAGSLDRPLDPLLASLEPQPLSRQAWPPPDLRLLVVHEAMAARNWSRAEALLKEPWRALLLLQRDANATRPAPGETQGPSLLTAPQWKGIGQPYVESLLRQGRTREAEDLLKDWERARGWEKARLRAADAAEACGMLDLAAVWRE